MDRARASPLDAGWARSRFFCRSDRRVSMRCLFALLLACCATAAMSHAADRPKLSPAEQEVVSVSVARMEAAGKRDMAAWTRYVAEDCIFSSDDGALLTKAQMIEHYRKLPALYDRVIDPR